MDDIFERAPEGTTEQFTEHLNTVDPTGSIKVTHEKEKERILPMLDASMRREENGSFSTKVYRKKTHTDQYLSFKSNHPLHQKLGVIRTLLDRGEAIASKPE